MADNIRTTVESQDTVVSVGRKTDSERIDGWQKMKVVVRVDDTMVDLNLPDTKDDVRIDVVKARESELTCAGNADFNPIPGGVQMDNTNATNGDGGTSACRINVTDVGYFMLSAFHVFDGDGDCYAGESGYQWGDYVGDVSSNYSNSRLDYCLISENNNNGISYDNTVRYDSGTTEKTYPIGGRTDNYDVLASMGKRSIGLGDGQTRQQERSLK